MARVPAAGSRPSAEPKPPGSVLVYGRPPVLEEEIEEVATLRSGWLGTGPRFGAFEEAFRDYVARRNEIWSRYDDAFAGLPVFPRRRTSPGRGTEATLHDPARPRRALDRSRALFALTIPAPLPRDAR
jgi:dTDP-4-amino-4,6-dideoxygalactose transaminase